MSRQASRLDCCKWLVVLSLAALLTSPAVALGEELDDTALDDIQPNDAYTELYETVVEDNGHVDAPVVNDGGNATDPAQIDVTPSQGDAISNGVVDGEDADENNEPATYLEETEIVTRSDDVESAAAGQEASSEPEGQSRDVDGADETNDAVLSAQDKEPAPLPDNAVSVKEGTYVIETNVSNEKVLDAAGKAPVEGSNVASYTYHAGENQKWIIRKDEVSSWYWILSAVDSVKLALGLSPTEGNPENVALVDPTVADDAALWAFVRNGSWYNLVNRVHPDLFLDVFNGDTNDNANVQLSEKKAAGEKGQRFYLIDTVVSVEAGTGAEEATFTVSPQANKDVVAEVRGAKTTTGANVWLYAANGKEHQKLYFDRDDEGFYTIWVVGTRRVLATETRSIVPGNNVVQRYYTENDPTKLWSIRKNSDGTYTFVNKSTGLALGVSGNKQGSNLFGTRNDGYVSTRFVLSRKALLTGGIVEIHPNTTSKVSLDVKGAASSGNANLVLWTDSDALNQRFELVSGGGTDLWRIRTASSGGWITDTGADVQQQGNGSSGATKANTWQVTFKGGGYCFVNRSTGRALDMSWGKTSRGTAIIGFKPNGRDSQHFSIERASLLKPGCYFLNCGAGGYLDIEDDSPSEGARAQRRSKDSYLGQYFTVEKVGESYRIKNTYSNRYIKANGSQNIVQGSRTASEAQKWMAFIEDGGRVGLRNASTGKVLDGSNADAVKVASSTHAKSQAWKLESTSYHPFSGYVLRAVNKANASRSSTKYLLVVDKSAHKVIAMTGGNGYWKPYKIMDCSVGAYRTPTVEGSFTVGSKGLSFGSGHTCWYWTQFYADYLFHSVLYKQGSKTSIQDGRLGMHISHGCVRMRIGDAKWIHDSVPRGTKVLIYS